jgi:hypothetical protein
MKLKLAISLFAFPILFACSHSSVYDPAIHSDFEGAPQGPIFYSKGQLTFYGDAARALFEDIQAKPITTPIGNEVKPAEPQTILLQCAKVQDKRDKGHRFYTCDIDAKELTRHPSK